MASVSLEGLNLARMHHHGASITASATASSLASSSPPSGHSTPKLDPRSPARDMERMGVMTLVRLRALGHRQHPFLKTSVQGRPPSCSCGGTTQMLLGPSETRRSEASCPAL